MSSSTGLGFTAGGLILLPLTAVTGGLAFRPALAALGWLTALAVGPTALAYTLYFRGLRSTREDRGAPFPARAAHRDGPQPLAFVGNRLSLAGIAGAILLAAAAASTVRVGRS